MGNSLCSRRSPSAGNSTDDAKTPLSETAAPAEKAAGESAENGATNGSVKEKKEDEVSDEEDEPPLKKPEGRMCPISGLIGICPMAKRREPLKEGEAPPELRVLMFLCWEEDASKVSLGIYPHNNEAWETLDLPDTATKAEIKDRFRKLSIRWHPDKNPDDPESAKKKFQKIKEAYNQLREVDGTLAFPWDKYPENQHTMTGVEVLRTFGFLAEEACRTDPIKGQFMTHVVREATDCKVLMWEKDRIEDCQRTKETWADALCVDSRSGANHLVKVYRRIVTLEFPDDVNPDAIS
eukprot:TRINITY_DN104976_c0_g1_i1.p1 TRINITY_DN104976_c0_g1~~TRINITY_DN104976_c0_g1_i1.p1  ORF type:complete len:294 (-),score=77.01 TRINITY_DN104976_c0_g1_i1:201-1082(-)